MGVGCESEGKGYSSSEVKEMGKKDGDYLWQSLLER